MAQNRLKWIRGNRLKLIIPMQRVDFTDHGKMTEDYFPPEGTEISVELAGQYRKFTFEPTIDENLCIIEDNGTLNVGDYAVVITATEPDGTRRRSKWKDIISIYDDNSPVVAEFDDFPDYAEGQVIEGSVFYFVENPQIQSDWAQTDPERKDYIKNKPDLSHFITNTVDDLVNYYLKIETYTKAEVNTLIEQVKQFTYLSVAELPTPSAETMWKIYLVPSADPQTQNVKDEFITVESGGQYVWEQIGSTAIDLSGYYTSAETDAAISAALTDYMLTTDIETALSGKQATIDAQHKLSADLVDDAQTTNKFVSAADKSSWNAKYDKPPGGIPGSDLDSGVQEDLHLAHTAVQTEEDPTVPQWAKAHTKPTYTAKEVGALPDDTVLFSGDYNDLTNKPTIPSFAMTKTVTVDYLQNADTVQWTNLYGNITVNYVAGVNVATLKVSHGSVLEQVVPMGSASINIDSNEVVTMKITRTSDLQDSCVSMRFGERTA